MGPEKRTCPASFPFSSNCIFPVSPPLLCSAFKNPHIRFSVIFYNCSPSLPTQKNFAVFCFQSPLKQKAFGSLFCSPPVVSDALLDGVAQDGHSDHSSSYKTLETMAEVRQHSPRIIRSLTTPHLIKWHPLQPTIIPLPPIPLRNNVGTASAIPAVQSRTRQYKNSAIAVAV